MRCGSCNSLERTRIIKLLLDQRGLPSKGARILHFAPEKGLSDWLSQISPESYDPVDLMPEGFPFAKVRQFNIVSDMEGLPSDHYDLILHSHVIEHIPINLAHFFFHVSRALKPDGLHIFSAPLMAGHYDEYFGPLTKEVARERFGQDDHVRKLGVEDLDLHLGAILHLDKDFDLTRQFSRATLDGCNIPLTQRSGLHGSTVFVAKKADYRLA